MTKIVYLIVGCATGGLIGYTMIETFGAWGYLIVMPWDITLGIMVGKAMRD